MPHKAIQLGPTDTVTGRLFTNPESGSFDLSILQYMVETMCRVMMHPEIIPDYPRPYIIFLDEVGGRFQRLVISKPEQLLKPDDLTVVGFCGKKRPDVDRGPLNSVDDQLIQEIPQHPYLLSYSTLQLECGNTVNLVLFNRPQGVSEWGDSETHLVAVRMSSEYYMVIRLHNAILPGGLMSDNKLILLRTKYYDFQEETHWRAVREFQPLMPDGKQLAV